VRSHWPDQSIPAGHELSSDPEHEPELSGDHEHELEPGEQSTDLPSVATRPSSPDDTPGGTGPSRGMRGRGMKGGIASRISSRWHNHGPGDRALRRLWVAGLVLLALQLVAMALWSTLLWSHFELSMDYGDYHQAWWLIAHGNIDPASTFFTIGHSFWQNNFELFMWPLALIGVVISHGPVLVIFQDLMLAVAEVVAWSWMLDYAARRLPPARAIILGSGGLVLLLANPWAWQAISFDFHMEIVGIAFLVLAARQLSRDRWSGWLWAALAASCGDATAAWVVGLAVGFFILSPKRQRRWVPVLLIGAAWLGISTIAHGDLGGNPVDLYGYLARSSANQATAMTPPGLGSIVLAVIHHPSRAIDALWAQRVNIWANLAPGGLIGILSPLTLGPGLADLLTVGLARGSHFSQPAFQSVGLYVLVPLGTVAVVSWAAHRFPRLATGVMVTVSANAIAWSVVWAPIIRTSWATVPTATASILRHVQEEIPARAEVIASQGVAGRYGDRKYDWALQGARERIKLSDRNTWWIIVPRYGIETAPVAEQEAMIAELAGPLHAKLVEHRFGVWVFHWLVPAHMKSLVTPPAATSVPAWLATGPAGRAVTTGPTSTWATVGTGQPGYVIAYDYFRLHPARYKAVVRLSTGVPVKVQVWNDTGGALLSSTIVKPATSPQTISLPVNALHFYAHHEDSGLGPFSARLVSPPKDDLFEIRIWSPGGRQVSVTQVGFALGAHQAALSTRG